MDKAKAAVTGFLSRDGKHVTDVDESVNPAVVSETIKPHRHEETQEAVDREVHQDHYHTTIQPVAQKEVLPEQHVHNLAPQVQQEFHHGDLEQDKARVASDLGQFQNTSTTHQTTQSTAAAPTAIGEHTHHHVHETVQPVIHKEVLAPEVVHTTIPIHEKHIAPSEHHGMSQLPMKTLDQMQSSGADLTAGSHQVHQYEGHPKPYNQAMQPHPADVDLHPGRHDGTHDPVKTGHFDHLKGSEAGTGAAATGAATGLGAREEAGYGSGAPLQQNTGDRYGASQGIGSSTGYGTGQGIGSSTGYGTGQGIGSSTGYGTGQGIGSSTGYSEGQGIGSTTGYGEGQGVGSTIGDRYGAGQGVGSTGTRDLTSGSGTLHEGTDVRHGGGALGGATAAAGAGAGAAGLASHHHHGEESGTLGHNETTTGSGFGSNTGNLGTTGRETGHGYNTTDDPSQRTSAGSMLTGAGDRHGLQDETTTDRSPATQQPSDTRNRDEPSNIEGEGAGKSIKPSGGDDIQHGSQGQDPSLVTDGKSKLTGTGVDGSHSAVFGLTPDGHRHKDTAHGSNTSQLPQDSDKNRDAGDRAGGHSDGRAGPESDEKRAGTEGVSEQLTDPNVASKGHSGQAEYGSGDGSKPGAGGATDKII